MMNWALKYRKMGLSIIPIKECGKEPLIKWQEFQQRLASEEEIREWWKKWPNANIGVVTGRISGICVMDLDGLEGLESAKKLNLTTISTAISLTGNGRHLWFKHPGGIVTNTVRQVPGIDIRGDGGYVLAAPSVHPNGRRYRWIAVLNAVGLPMLPEILLNGKAAPSISVKKEESWIAKALEEMHVGNIDNTLVSILGRLRHDGYSSEDARALLLLPALQAGATDGHLEEKIRNVWSRYDSAQQRTRALLPDLSSEASETVEEFLKEEEPVKWLIDSFVARNSIGFCVGLPESAKTWLMMDLAISVASGSSWISNFPTTKGRVLFIEQERFRGETKRRFRRLLLGRGLSDGDMDNLNIKCGSTIKINLENSYTAFVRLLEKVRPELVIVDSLATIHTKEENNRMEIQSVMEKFKILRQQFNCAFWFISHPSKFEFQAAKEGEDPNTGAMAGSIAIPAVAEGILFVRKAKGGGSTVYHIKNTLGPKNPPFGIVVEDVSDGIVVRGIK